MMKSTMTKQQIDLSVGQMGKLYERFYSVSPSSRPFVAATEIGLLFPMFVKHASEFKHDAHMPSEVTPLTDADVANMPYEELKQLRESYQKPQLGIEKARKMKDCLVCLESVKGWGIADSVAGEMQTVIDAYDDNKAVINSNRALLQAEISRRDAIAEKEARKRRYIEENYVDIIETLLSGGGKDELLQTLENPPESDSGNGAQTVDIVAVNFFADAVDE